RSATPSCSTPLPSTTLFRSRPERRDHVLDLLVFEDSIESSLLDVKNLSTQGKDGLEMTIAGLLGGPAGRPAIVISRPSFPCVERDRKSTRLNSSHVKTSYAV